MTKMVQLLQISVMLSAVMGIQGQHEIITRTNLGDIRGVKKELQNSFVYNYRKIPYAKAPVGKLRFEKPQLYGSWVGILDARNYGPACYQDKIYTLHNVSEDCLYLNIHVPFNVSSTNNKSVMVWIHGGGYSVGEAAAYDGNYLAVTGDVIIVTINYRLNIFGFFSTSAVKGNYGLWDQTMAIQWVKDNIGPYGGNSQSITIFGESAGGFSVGLLSIIPRNRGLFQRAILQSGTALSSYTTGTIAKQASLQIAHSLNCTQTNDILFVQCLKNLDGSDLYTAFATGVFTSSLLLIPFGPVIDGELLTDDPNTILADTTSEGYLFFSSLDVIIGVMSGEASLLIATLTYAQDYYKFNISDHIPRRFLCDVLATDVAAVGFDSDVSIKSAICEKYGAANNLTVQSLNATNIYSDFIFNIPATKSLIAHSKSVNNGGSRFQYIFSRVAPISLLGKMPWWFTGAGHADEIPFQFPYTPLNVTDNTLATDFMKYWTNFAKTGDVNGDGLLEWKQFDILNGYYINLDVNITSGNQLFNNRVKFWLNDIPAILLQKEGPTSSCNCIHICSSMLYLSLMIILTVIYI